ncbi:MAG: GMC family oxidoreductase [Nitrospiraceae bacterium]|nr:GMC family oxidoreductase [Nitrospiraceae bacterium]
MADTDFDVVIIGSGAGGGASAWSLSRRKIRVLLLDAGPSYDPSEYGLYKTDWEQRLFPEKAKHRARYTFGPMQELSPERDGLRTWNHLSGKINATGRRIAGEYYHKRGIGGSTLVFSGEAHRLNPESMKMYSRFGVGADWPLTYKELEAYYCIAERIVGVAGPPGEVVRFRSEPYPLPPHRLSYASSKVRDGCRALGLTWVENAVAILSRPYGGRPECNYCANCYRGCTRTDKGSTDVTFIRKAVETGFCTVRTDSQVTRLEAGPADRVTAVHYVDGENREHETSAGAVVVACGAIETPRLLLASKNRNAPDGLGNESGQAGRNFMETLAWSSTGLHPEPLGSHRGIPVDSVCWDFNAPDSMRGIAGGCRFCSATPEADLLGPINYAKRVVKGWGRRHKEEMRRVFGSALTIIAMGESLPNEKSFIDLDPHEKDGLGMPVARINTFLDGMETARLEFMASKTREILQASGAEKTIEEFGTYDIFSSTHVFGTCRMGTDPEQSVLDAYGRSHRWKNLFMADASVFPSSGGGESPSLTIEALAIRTAEHILSLSKRGEL